MDGRTVCLPASSTINRRRPPIRKTLPAQVHPLASFLLGIPEGGTRNVGVTAAYMAGTNEAVAYVQDDIKLEIQPDLSTWDCATNMTSGPWKFTDTFPSLTLPTISSCGRETIP